MNNIEKAIALLRENIATVPPHGCQRDEVLALLTAEPTLERLTETAETITRWIDTQQEGYLPKESHEDGC